MQVPALAGRTPTGGTDPGAGEPALARYKDRIDEVERAKNRTKSTVRSKVEHVFAVMKLKFGFVKLRY